ncbi:HD domain-containing phosphohydrolase [Clostridium paraputrificum]|uniref:sensor domain-containing diguanylate cyclase/phosphohydrolase n=1 Tax=Clostridium paraputrificum TaxID=29363 RepID=UPI003D33712A
MIDLISKFINIVPFPAWIGTRNKIIYINDYFSIKLKAEVSNLNILANNIIVIDKERELLISKENNSTFIYNGRKYNHKIIKETINNEEIEIGLLLDEDYLNNLDIENPTNILQTVIDNVPEIIFYKDKAGIYRGANKQCLEFYNSLGVAEVIGKSDLDLPLNRDFIETCIKNDSMVLRNKKPLFIEEEWKNSEGIVETFETIKTPILNRNNEVWGLVGVARDITTRKEKERRLKYLSYTDVLTGLYNRASFDEKIDQLVKNKNFPIGIIMGDINGLKLVNDTFGHIAGDDLIKRTANTIKNACKNNELIFRWGGDEFIILIPKCSDDNCEELMNNIDLALTNSIDERVPLSMSMGSSFIKNDESSIDIALREAEDKLYRKKIVAGKSIRSSILSTLQESLQCKNVETAEHTERILDYCIKIAECLNLKQDTINELILVARLHDIGKIAIPENILLKPSKLTDDEYEIMKTHSEKGYRLAMTIPEISHVARGILTHHERWDGKGYPLGISGEEIPLIARIVSVVDSYDAMTSNRVYNIVKTKSEAIEELQRCSGYQFDPNIVEIFCGILKEEKK